MKKIACFLPAVLLISAFLNAGLLFKAPVANAAGSDALTLNQPFLEALLAAGLDTNHDGAISQDEMAKPQSLSISGYQITDITGIEYATNLTSLTVSGTGITGLPSGFSDLTNLTDLDLSDNDISVFPDVLLGMTNIQTLDLKLNGISTVPSGIGGMTGLEELNLYLNGLTSLPPSIGDLTNLRKLILHRNHLSSLPASIGNLSNLTELTAWDNWLTDLPPGIFDGMASLATLDLSNNYFNPGNLPGGIPAFAVMSPQKSYAFSLAYNGGSPVGDTHLKTSYYYGESLTLPDAAKPGFTFSGWDTDGDGKPDAQPGDTVCVKPSPVAAASVSYSAVYGYPVTFKTQPFGTIGGGTADITVSVNPGGKVSSVPEEAAEEGYVFLGWFEGGAPVTKDDILNAQIDSSRMFTAEFEAIGTIRFPDAAFGAAVAAAGADANGDGFVTKDEMSRVTALTLNGGFSDIAGIGNATALQSLTLGPGGVTALPDELCGLTDLTYLDVGGNPIHELPGGIGDLSSLETLKMGGCGLEALPSRIQDLSALKYLDASGNNLIDVPSWLASMPGLESLDLSGNWFDPDDMPAGTPAFAVVSPQKTYAVTLDFNRGTGDALPKPGYYRGEPIPLPDASRFDYDFIGWDANGDGTADTAGAGTVALTPTPPDSIAAKTYTAVYVCRSARLSGIALSASALSPAFDIDTLSYSVYLPNSVPQVTISPAALSGGSFLMDGSSAASETVTLPPGGKAAVSIVCSQPNKNDVTYTVGVYRVAPVMALNVQGGALSPAFSVNTPAYNVSVPAATASVVVTPVVSASCASMTMDGESLDSRTLSPLAGCSAQTVVRATAVNGQVFQYTVTVSRAAALTGVKFSAGRMTPSSFSCGVNSYTIDVAATVSSVKITPTKARTGVKYITINGKKTGSYTAKPPVGGSVPVALVAYGLDGKPKASYTFTVRRAALVASITDSTGTLAFSSGTYSYTVGIPADTKSVTVQATGVPGLRSLTNADVTLCPPVGGSASAVITALASDGRTKSSYTVKAVRAPIISGIKAVGGSLAFNPASGSFRINVPATTASVTLTPSKAADCATLTIDGQEKDSVTLCPPVGGSASTVIAGSTASGTSVSYTVTVYRAALLTNVCSGTKAYPVSPAFSPANLEYTVTLPATAGSVTIRATKAKTGVKYLYFNGVLATSYTAKPPVGGSVDVYVTAVASDGVTQVTYHVKVVRAAAP